jgi:Na+-transporting NADH:ubiquinone oxidoreductase subunit NqrC
MPRHGRYQRRALITIGRRTTSLSATTYYLLKHKYEKERFLDEMRSILKWAHKGQIELNVQSITTWLIAAGIQDENVEYKNNVFTAKQNVFQPTEIGQNKDGTKRFSKYQGTVRLVRPKFYEDNEEEYQIIRIAVEEEAILFTNTHNTYLFNDLFH